MSSFWNLFGSNKEEKPGGEGDEADGIAVPAIEPPLPSSPQASAAPAPTKQPLTLTAPPNMAAGVPAQPSGAPPVKPIPQLSAQRFGIDDAIKLMRTLPVDENVDLVVRVVKRTLESMSVRVTDIIEDASGRQESLRAKITEHQGAILQLQREIEARRGEISRLEEELAETTTVRERLQLAEAMTNAATPASPGVKSSSAIPPPIVPSRKPEPPVVQRSAPPTAPSTFKPTLPNLPRKPLATQPEASPTPATPASTASGQVTPPPLPIPPPPAALNLPKAIEDEEEETSVESRDLLPPPKGT